MIGTPLAGRTGRQVTNQVTTAPDNARSGETSSDAARGLACGNRTQRDALRQNRAAWHAEGQGFESLSSTEPVFPAQRPRESHAPHRRASAGLRSCQPTSSFLQVRAVLRIRGDLLRSPAGRLRARLWPGSSHCRSRRGARRGARRLERVLQAVRSRSGPASAYWQWPATSCHFFWTPGAARTQERIAIL